MIKKLNLCWFCLISEIKIILKGGLSLEKLFKTKLEPINLNLPYY